MVVTSLFETQVEQLANKVRRLAASSGRDEQAYNAVRRQVSGELMNQGKLEIVAGALGALDDGEGAELLTEIISHCHDHYYLEDRVLSAVVVPVTVRLKSRTDGGVLLSEAGERDLSTLTSRLQRQFGARKIVFDKRFYDGKSLFYGNPKKLMEFLERLEAGEDKPEGGPKSVVIRSKAEWEWEVVYLLGVEVLDQGQAQVLNEESSQREIVKFHHHAAWAISESDSVLFNTHVEAQAQCHGIYYLGQGLAIGEDLIRGYKLQSLLANFDQGVTGVKFHYMHDQLNFFVKLLISSHAMTVEYRWKLMGNESLDGFKSELKKAIDLVIPADDVLVIRELDQYDYEALARAEGLIWQ